MHGVVLSPQEPHGCRSRARRVHPRPVAALHQLAAVGGAVPVRRLRPGHARVAGSARHRRRGARASGEPGRDRHRPGHRLPRPTGRGHARAARPDRALLRRPGRDVAAGPRTRTGGHRDRPGADPGRRPNARRAAGLGLPGAAQPGQPQPCRKPHARPVPEHLRQRAARGGVRAAPRAVDDPRPRPATVPGRAGQRHPEVARRHRRRHAQVRPGAAADHLGRGRPHDPGQREPRGLQDVWEIRRGDGVPAVSGPRPLPHGGLGLAGRRPGGAELADEAGDPGQTPAP